MSARIFLQDYEKNTLHNKNSYAIDLRTARQRAIYQKDKTQQTGENLEHRFFVKTAALYFVGLRRNRFDLLLHILGGQNAEAS